MNDPLQYFSGREIEKVLPSFNYPKGRQHGPDPLGELRPPSDRTRSCR